MQSQKDYSGDVEIIPGVLRGYRQFRIIANNHYTLSGLSGLDPLVFASPFYSYLWQEGWNESCCNNATKASIIESSGCRSCDSMFVMQEYSFYPNQLDADGTVEVNVSCLCQASWDKLLRAYQATSILSESESTAKRRRARIKIDKKHPDQEVPHADCQCGFYAAYTMGDLAAAPGISWNSGLTKMGSVNRWPMGKEMQLVGVVESAGRIMLGKSGFRAKKMRVVGVAMLPVSDYLFEPAAIDDLMQKLRSWGIRTFSSPKNMCVAYPPNDLAEILPTAQKAPDGLDDYDQWFMWLRMMDWLR